MSDSKLAVVVRFTIHPEHFSDFLQAVRQQASNSLENEVTCRQFDVMIGEEANTILLFEVYDDLEAFTAHRQTPYFADFNSTVAPWVVDKQLSTWTVTPQKPKGTA